MPDPTPSRENLADAQAAAGPCPHHAVAKAWPLMIETIARCFAYREAETAARDARIAELEARIRERHDRYCRVSGRWRPGERHAPECLAEDAGVDVGGPDA